MLFVNPLSANEAVYFITPAVGSPVQSPLSVCVGMHGFDEEKIGRVTPAEAGHFLLLVDAPLPKDLRKPVSSQVEGFSLLKGSTCKELEMEPGTHVLRTVFLDQTNRPYQPLLTDTIFVEVDGSKPPMDITEETFTSDFPESDDLWGSEEWVVAGEPVAREASWQPLIENEPLPREEIADPTRRDWTGKAGVLGVKVPKPSTEVSESSVIISLPVTQSIEVIGTVHSNLMHKIELRDLVRNERLALWEGMGTSKLGALQFKIDSPPGVTEPYRLESIFSFSSNKGKTWKVAEARVFKGSSCETIFRIGSGDGQGQEFNKANLIFSDLNKKGVRFCD